MKYRVTRIQELDNPNFGQSDGSTAAERKTQAREPAFIYEVDLIVENEHCGGMMTLNYRYVPMLSVGSVYTMQELEDM